MKKHFLKLVCLLLFAYPQDSDAICNMEFDGFISGVYIGAFGGINGGYPLRCEPIKTNRGYYAGLKAGKRFFSYLRFEGEIAWQQNDPNELQDQTIPVDTVRGKIGIWSGMGNGLIEIPLNCGLPGRPYFGGGVGYANVSGDWMIDQRQQPDNVLINVRKKTETKYNNGGFAWQLLAGLNFPLCWKLTITLDYRYFKLGSSISNHKLGLGLTKEF